jgi:hypothetical protein
MKMFNDEHGQTLVLIALSMTVLLGFMALAIDVGALFRAKRNIQIAADAAAIAGALATRYPGAVTPTKAVYNAAAANGITVPSQVSMNFAPTGPHSGSSFTEVVITQPNPTFFMGVITGGNFVNVAARAEAGAVFNPACIYILDPGDPETLDLQGNVTITTPNCGIVVDSTSPSAVCITGGATTFTNVSFVNAVGAQGSGHCGGLPSGTPVNTGTLSQNDPLNIVGPTPSDCSSSSNIVAQASPTLAQVAAASPSSTGVICFSSPNVTLPAGLSLTGTGTGTVYLFENGVTLSGNTTVTNGTFDIYQGQFTQNNAVLTMTASTSLTSAYNGIAIMQPSTNTTDTCKDPKTTTPCIQVQFGSGAGNLDGMIYAPTSEVYMQDNGGGTVTTGIIAYKIFEKASSLVITNSYNAAHPITSPLSTVELVE